MSLLLHRVGLLRPTLGAPSDTVPDAFELDHWSVAPGDEKVDITINALPADGGDTITDIEYRLNGGSWISSGGTSSFTISGLTNDQEYDVELRAVNSVGAGAASDTKLATPTGSALTFEQEVIGLLGAKCRAFWLYDEPSHLWQDTGATTPVASDTDPVARVDDLSGNEKHLLQGTAANRPAFRTGPSRVTFDGVNDHLLVASAAFPIDAYELFMVYEEPTAAANLAGITVFAPASGNDWNDASAMEINAGSSAQYMRATALNSSLDVNLAGSGASPLSLYEIVKTATTISLRRNDGSAATDSSFTALASPHSGNFYDGCRFNTAGGGGGGVTAFATLARRLTIMTASLTSGERADLRDLINARYSLW